MKLGIKNETAPLKRVILGSAESFGGTPEVDETYDPNSRYHVKNNSFPTEEKLNDELEGFKEVLEKHGVEVIRPTNIVRLNQIYVRDIGFIIDKTFIVSNVIADRHDEIKGIEDTIKSFDREHILKPSPDVRIEGSDVIIWNNHLFVGYSPDEHFDTWQTARTNLNGIDFLRTHFPHYTIHPLELIKSDDTPLENCLHLDSCFQPVGESHALVCKEGFVNESEYQAIVETFGEEQLIPISKDEMSEMMCNVFSVSPTVVISEVSFERINAILSSLGLTVEPIKFKEVRKMSGLLRCTTLPLLRA